MPLLKVKIGDYEFAPGITGTVITLLLFSLFVYLGAWQFMRMETKQALTEDLKKRATEEVIDFSSDTDEMIARDFESFRFQRMQVTGHFLENKDILLDNQVYEGRAGYEVFTPFVLDIASKQDESNKSSEKPDDKPGENSKQSENRDPKILVLIDRGWIPWGLDRDELPSIPKITGTHTVIGIINKYPAGLQLGKEELSTEVWPHLVQSIRYQDLSLILQEPVAHFILQLPEGNPYSFKIKPLYFGLSADRHLGYAIQWFTMALAVLIYYMVINLRHII